GSYHNAMNQLEITDAVEIIINMGNRYNSFIDAQAPWKLKKDNPKQMESVLYALAAGIRKIAILAWPFMPMACDKILNQLSIPLAARDFKSDFILAPGT